MQSSLLILANELATAAGFVACVAGFVYFLIERTSFAGTSRRIVSKATLLSGLGAMYFAGLLLGDSESSNILAASGAITTPMTLMGETQSATEPATISPLSLAIWTIAAPVVTVIVSQTVGTQQATQTISNRMAVASILAVIAGYLSTASSVTGGAESTTLGLFAVSVVAFVYTTTLMFGALNEQAESSSTTMEQGYTNTRNLAAIGVGLFPAISILSLMGAANPASPLAQFVMTLASLAALAGIPYAAVTSARAEGTASSGSGSVANDGNTIDLARRLASQPRRKSGGQRRRA